MFILFPISKYFFRRITEIFVTRFVNLLKTAYRQILHARANSRRARLSEHVTRKSKTYPITGRNGIGISEKVKYNC